MLYDTICIPGCIPPPPTVRFGCTYTRSLMKPLSSGAIYYIRCLPTARQFCLASKGRPCLLESQIIKFVAVYALDDKQRYVRRMVPSVYFRVIFPLSRTINYSIVPLLKAIRSLLLGQLATGCKIIMVIKSKRGVYTPEKNGGKVNVFLPWRFFDAACSC